MYKSHSFALALAVICLPVIFSSEEQTQPATNETSSCRPSSSVNEVKKLVETIASNQQQSADEIKDVKQLLALKTCEFTANFSTFLLSPSSYSIEKVSSMVRIIAIDQQENAQEIKKIASNQQENANDIRDVKDLLASNTSALQEVVNLMKTIASNLEQNAKEIQKIASV